MKGVLLTSYVRTIDINQNCPGQTGTFKHSVNTILNPAEVIGGGAGGWG